ncbi:methyltransferase domain-containing protein [Pseudonocardia endophytica]|uniref:Methyltransferase family protein n=1 Tax=Pseudonocardia endophytica TaxID=401976 RepID=A0A4R1HSU3_PSEEN|nr:methyltransferase domain-containing protein [Pseudonocardia endophytica]TCK25248.1 methyltransferase family protein [Pseudonocardia endophytica]
MLPFDDGDSARRLAATYATPDVVGQRRRTLELLDVRPGERVLDVGTGPGQLLASLAAAVGPTGAAAGLDPSPAMAAMARERCGDLATVSDGGVDGAGSLPDGPFDALVCTQVMEYVPDVPAALREFARVLRPGGRVLVLDTDWDSAVWHVDDRDRHRRVMDAWDDHLAHPRLPSTLGPLLRGAGFDDVRVDVIPLLNPVWDTDTFSAGMSRMIARYVPGHQGVTDDEARAWLADVTDRDDYFFSLNRYCFRAALP